MNKQEQIEKMIDVMVDSEDCIKAMYGKRLDTDYRVVANTFVEAGYINGADFVEWLKSSRFVKPYMDDIDYCIGIDVEVLAKALKEYLKGE